MKLSLCSLLVVVSVINPARAGFITELSVSQTTLDGGSYRYSYILTNDSLSTLDVVDFTILISADSYLTNIQQPQGWTVQYEPNTPVLSLFPDDTLGFVLPGNSVNFSFESRLSPSQQPYLIAGFDPVNGDSTTNFGLISGPAISSVAEPASMIPLGFGMTTLAAYSTYRGRRKQ